MITKISQLMWSETQLSQFMKLCRPLPNLHGSQAMLQLLSFPWTNPRSSPNSIFMERAEDVEEKALDLSIKSSRRDSLTPSFPPSSVETGLSSSFCSLIPLNYDQDLSCPLCKKPFRFEKNLLRHLQKTHAAGNEESILKCKLCPYTTRHYSNMYVHIRTHTGDKPYSCSGCGASFTQGSSLKLHIRSRHDENMSLFSLSRKPGKNNLTKLWTRVVRLDSNVNLPVAQSSLYILPPQQLLGVPPSLGSVNNDLRFNEDNRSRGAFSVEALTSSPPPHDPQQQH